MISRVIYWIDKMLGRIIFELPRIKKQLFLFLDDPGDYLKEMVALSKLSISTLCRIKIYSLRILVIILLLGIGFFCLINIPDLRGAATGTFESIAKLHDGFTENKLKDLNSLMYFLGIIAGVATFLLVVCGGLFIMTTLAINKKIDQVSIKNVMHYKMQTKKLNRDMWNLINFIGPLILAFSLFGMSYHLGPNTPDTIEPAKTKNNIQLYISHEMEQQGYLFWELSDEEILVDKCLNNENSKFFVAKKEKINEKILVNFSCELDKGETSEIFDDTVKVTIASEI